MNVLIVGSGVIGLSIAFELALAGHRITVVTRNYEEGASWVAGGMLAPLSEGLEGDLLDFSAEGLSLYPEFLKRLEEVSRLRIFFGREGTLRLILSEEEEEGFKRKEDLYKSKGFRVEHLSLNDLKGEPILDGEIRRVLLFEDEGNVDAEKLMDALLLACENLKIRIAIDDITEVKRKGNKVEEVKGYRGSYRADLYVFATGAWSRPLLKLPVFPIKGEILKIKGLEPRRVLYSSRSYIIPKEGFVLVGATSEDVGFDTRPTAGGVKSLLEGAISVLPALAEAEFMGVKVGFRPATPDEKPILDAGENFVISTGHYRNGILWAPITAKIVLDLVDRGVRSPFFDTFSSDRFQNKDHIVRRGESY